MRTANLLDAHPTFFDLNGKPLVGRVSVFENETRTFADTWLDPDGSKRAANPMKTNGAGKLENQVFVGMPDSGQRLYTVVVEKFLGSQYSSMDEYWDDGEMWEKVYDFKLVVDAGSGVKSVTADSVSQIPGMDSGNGIVVATGFYRKGDCPARVFVYTDKAVFPEDGCTSIKSKDGGYWTWFPEPVVDSGCFGIIPSESSANINSGFLSLQSHRASSDIIKRVCFRNGTYILSVSLSIDCEMEFKQLAKINPASDISLSFRSVSAAAGFIGMDIFRKKVSLSVKEGTFYLSWYDKYDDYSEIGDIGTPDTVIIDKPLKLVQTAIRSALIVGAGKQVKFKSNFSFNGCRFSGTTITSSSENVLFANCGKLRTSEVCDTFYASTIAANAVGTKFVVDSEVVMDANLSQDETGFTTEDGAFFNGNADPGTLTIDAKSIGMWMLACETCVKNAQEIRFDWFRPGIIAANRLSLSCSASSIFAVDLCGLSLVEGTSLYAMSYRNGTLSGSYTKDLSLDGIAGDISIRDAALVVKDSNVKFNKLNVTNLAVSNSVCSGASLQVEGDVSVSDSSLQFTTTSIKSSTAKFLDSAITGSGTIVADRFSSDGTNMSGVEISASKLASVSQSTIGALTADVRYINSSIIKSDDVIFDNQTESVIRKEKTLSDGLMYRTEESYPLIDVNAQTRFNAGIYNMASKGRTEIDMFGLIPSFPIFVTQDDFVSLLDPVGSSREVTFHDSTNTEIRFTAYGIIGKSRPKTGQVLVIISSGSGSRTRCLIGRAIRATGFDGSADIVFSRYGEAQDTDLQPFPDSVAHKRLIINDGPIILYCLGPGYVGNNLVPIFWNLNGTTYELD